MTGKMTLGLFSVEHDVINAGTTIPAAPAAAAVPRKLLLVMDDFFMMVMVGCSKIMFLSQGLMSEGLKVSGLKV